MCKGYSWKAQFCSVAGEKYVCLDLTISTCLAAKLCHPSKQWKCFVLSYKLCFLLSSLFSQPCSLAVSICTLCLSWFTKISGHWVQWGINKVSTLDVRMSYITAQHKARLLFNCIFPSWAKIHLNWTFPCAIYSEVYALPLLLCFQISWCSFVMLNA